ncbi:tetraspanin-15-like [Mercurialis annua]|uniref:tetraspanin-15-like n=1 Tax=Mercurialis annua TaxID=3986 RepID=UPI00215E26AD|nr:tetraspanin-15-like [Mercurialis annua]
MAHNTKLNPNPNPNSNRIETLAITLTEEETKANKSVSKFKSIKIKDVAWLISIVTIILSLPILASAVSLLYMQDYDCEKLLSLPKVQTGIAVGLLFVFLISNGAVYASRKIPVPGFFIAMVSLLFIFTMGLALVGSDKMESKRVMATPRWFKDKVGDEYYWTNIKSCIYSKGFCDDLAYRSVNVKAYQFSLKKLSSIEDGCCKPPDSCRMEYTNATYWTKGDNRIFEERSHNKIYNGDCEIWNNSRNMLCYECESCRQGFVHILETKWKKLGVFLIVMPLFLIIAHILLFIVVMWKRYLTQS